MFSEIAGFHFAGGALTGLQSLVLAVVVLLFGERLMAISSARRKLIRLKRDPASLASGAQMVLTVLLPKTKARTRLLSKLAALAASTGVLGAMTGVGLAAYALLMTTSDSRKVLQRAISLAVNTTSYAVTIALLCMTARLVLFRATQRIGIVVRPPDIAENIT